MLRERTYTLKPRCESYLFIAIMDEIMLKLDSLRLLPVIPDERKDLERARDKLQSIVPHPVGRVREQMKFLIKEMSSFLDLFIKERVLEPKGDLFYMSELWEYVDAIATVCDRRTTSHDDLTTDPRFKDYRPVERRRKRMPKAENTNFEVERRSETSENEVTVVIGSEANLDGIDELLDWPG